MLMRKYRLHWLVGGLVLLALCSSGKIPSASFPRTPTTGIGSEFIAGKDATAGFVNLLRRNIAPAANSSTCVSTSGPGRGCTAAISASPEWTRPRP